MLYWVRSGPSSAHSSPKNAMRSYWLSSASRRRMHRRAVTFVELMKSAVNILSVGECSYVTLYGIAAKAAMGRSLPSMCSSVDTCTTTSSKAPRPSFMRRLACQEFKHRPPTSSPVPESSQTAPDEAHLCTFLGNRLAGGQLHSLIISVMDMDALSRHEQRTSPACGDGEWSKRHWCTCLWGQPSATSACAMMPSKCSAGSPSALHVVQEPMKAKCTPSNSWPQTTCQGMKSRTVQPCSQSDVLRVTIAAT